MDHRHRWSLVLLSVVVVHHQHYTHSVSVTTSFAVWHTYRFPGSVNLWSNEPALQASAPMAGLILGVATAAQDRMYDGPD